MRVMYKLNFQAELWICAIRGKTNKQKKCKHPNIRTFSLPPFFFFTVLQKLHPKHLGTELLQNKLNIKCK